jgi:radical SAM protein with 4Fe4S-binding SPASM domain
MIAMIKGKGFNTVLITNGTLLNRGMIKRLIDSGVDTLNVSLWATSTEQYKSNYIGADPNNFNKVKESLSLLSRLKSERSVLSPQVNIYYAINRTNFKTLEQMVLLASEWGCEKITFSPMADVTNELKELVLTDSEIQSVKNTLFRLKKDSGCINTVDRTLLRYDLKDELWKHLPCTIAWFHARIRVDGSVQPCGRCDSEVIFGNLHQQSFKEIWNDQQIQKFRYQRLNQIETDFWKDHCACTSCCFVQEMKRIHNVLRWYRHTPVPKGDH